MQRVTLTLDDDLLAALDAHSAHRGYHNRSEAVRDILRDALHHNPLQQPTQRGYAVLSYVYEHENANWRAGWSPLRISITISRSLRYMSTSIMMTVWRSRC